MNTAKLSDLFHQFTLAGSIAIDDFTSRHGNPMVSWRPYAGPQSVIAFLADSAVIIGPGGFEHVTNPVVVGMLAPDPEACPDTPSHYAGDVTPWDLQACMKTSGYPFVDLRRADAIKYCFRVKTSTLDDLRKALHCIAAAIHYLETAKK